jgi:hypothetical protein
VCRTAKENIKESVNEINLLVHFMRPPLCSSDQSSWLQMQRSGFDSRRYKFSEK